MSCAIDYIEELPLQTREEKDRLTKLHIELARRINNHRVDNMGYVNKIFQFKNNKLVVPGSGSTYKDAVKLLEIINTDLGFEAVKLVPDPQVSTRHFVSIDVRPDQTIPVDTDTEEKMQTFYKNVLGDSEIVTGSLEFEDAAMDVEHAQKFKEITDSIGEKARLYLNGLEKSGDYYKSNKTEKDLRILLGTLKDESTYGLMESVSKYIVMSGFNLGNIKRRLGVINTKITQLSDVPEVRKDQLKEVADFVRHSTYFYHLFDILEDMAREFTTLGINPRPIDNYERDLLERDLRYMMESDGVFSEEEIVDFLNLTATEIGDSGNLINIYKSMFKDKMGESVVPYDRYQEIEMNFQDVLTASLRPNGGIQQQLENTLKALRPLKTDLKNLHYDVLTEIYYPSFTKTFKGKELKLSIDGKHNLGDKYMIPKKEFKDLLRIAEEDIGAIEKWGSAMINASDTISTTVASFFKEVMIDIDLNNKEDISGLQKFLSKEGRVQGDSLLKETDAQAVHFNNTIEAVEQVDDTYVPKTGDSVIEMTVMGITGKYRARITKNYLSRFNSIAYNNFKKVFSHHVDAVAEDFAEKIQIDKYSLEDIDLSDPILRRFYNLLYSDGPNGTKVIANHVGVFLDNAPTHQEVVNKMRTMLFNAFYAHNLRNKEDKEVTQMFLDNGVMDGSGRLVDLNDDANSKAKNHILRNSSWNAMKEYTRNMVASSSLQDRFHFNSDSLFGEGSKTSKRVLVRYTDQTLGYVELTASGRGVIIQNTSGKEIQDYATFSKDYISLTDDYDIEKGGFGAESQRKWEAIQGDTFKKGYFDRLISLYKGANSNYTEVALQNYEVPQVQKMEGNSKLAKLKNAAQQTVAGNGVEVFGNYMNGYLIDEDKIPLMRNGQYVDDEGNPVNDPIYISTERQYINGQKIRNVKARFNRPIPLDQIESDLYLSTLMYKTASNVYRGLKDNESQALLLQSVLEGDATLGLPKRKAKVKKRGETVKIPGGGIKYKEHELRTSEMMVSFINDYVFGLDMEDTNILGTGISAKKVAGMISGYAAYTALAWNAFTILPNRLISLHNTKVVAEGNEFFNERNWKDSIAIYHKNLPNFMNDFKTKGFTTEKSLLTQLGIHMNAVQGEFLSPKGSIDSKNLAEKMSESALYWTQEIAEHANQYESMIMLMKGYMLPTNAEGKDLSLWDAFEEANKNHKQGDAMILPEGLTRELEIDFQKRLQGVNRQIHGNYAKLDKNMMQKSVMTNMLMTFKKYIYDGFRARYQSERWDQELRDEQEGYFRTYLKAMNQEFTETAKTQGLTAALKSSGVKSLGKSLLKTSLGGWDAAFGGLVSGRNNVNGVQSEISKWLYGDKNSITDRQYYAAMKATYDVGNMVRAMLLIIAVEAIMSGLDDDDEELNFILSYVDIYAKKIEGDIGLFTSFTNFATGPFVGGATLDQMYRLWKAPMAASRSIDNTTGIFKQLISFEAMNEDGEFEFSWGALDKYEKSGDGYEKGDYKIARKIQKSVFSPIAQMYKIADPGQQLKYLEMVQKYSN